MFCYILIVILTSLLEISVVSYRKTKKKTKITRRAIRLSVSVIIMVVGKQISFNFIM